MRWFKVLGFVVAGVLASASMSSAQVAGKWGLGGFVSYTKPVFTFADRFDGGVNKWGLTGSYVSNSRVTLEAEYHHAQMDGGVLESGEFTWSPKALTPKKYSSKDINPNSLYTTRFNSVLLSGLWFFNVDRSLTEGSFSPYIVVGGGFYDHKTVAENIVWPGQSSAEALSVDPKTLKPLDNPSPDGPQFEEVAANVDTQGDILPQVVMDRQEDTRTAVTAALGLGLEAFLTPTIALDVRGRYHFILGELRPYDAWGLNKAFPLQMYDLSAGFKFYFWD